MAEQRPILLLAETGFIIRNLLLGTFADALAGERPLVVAVPNPDDPRLREALRGRRLELIAFPRPAEVVPRSRTEALFRWQTVIYRLKEAEKATASMRLQAQLYETSHSAAGAAVIGALHGAGRALKHLRLMGVVEDRYLRSVEEWPVTREWREILERVRPAAVVSTVLTLATNRKASADLAPLVAAHGLGIPTGTLIQSWDNLSSKTAVLPPWVDRYWTWSETMSEELLSLNPRISAGALRVVGSPQFDFHRRPEMVEPREAYLRGLGLDPARPYVVIGTGTAVWMPNEPDTVMSLIRALNREGSVQVVVRLHPKDDGTRWEPMLAELGALGAVIQRTAPPVHMDLGGFVPPRDFYRDQVNCLTHAAVVLNTASTLTVDAAILDRPVICFGYDVAADPKFPDGRALAYSRSTHYSHLVRTGGVRVVRSEAECVHAVRAALRDPSLGREERARIVATVTGDADGRAGERLATEVARLACAARPERARAAGAAQPREPARHATVADGPVIHGK